MLSVFTAKLVDVRPDGYAQNLADSIIRARYRDSRANPSSITPGVVYEYSIAIRTPGILCSMMPSSGPRRRRFSMMQRGLRTLCCR
jgi:hypothetical protein